MENNNDKPVDSEPVCSLCNGTGKQISGHDVAEYYKEDVDSGPVYKWIDLKDEGEFRNKVLQQLRFHSISGQDEEPTVSHIVAIAREYFSLHAKEINQPENKWKGLCERLLKEMDSAEWVSPMQEEARSLLNNQSEINQPVEDKLQWTDELIVMYAEAYRFSSGRISLKQFEKMIDIDWDWDKPLRKTANELIKEWEDQSIPAPVEDWTKEELKALGFDFDELPVP